MTDNAKLVFTRYRVSLATRLPGCCPPLPTPPPTDWRSCDIIGASLIRSNRLNFVRQRPNINILFCTRYQPTRRVSQFTDGKSELEDHYKCDFYMFAVRKCLAAATSVTRFVSSTNLARSSPSLPLPFPFPFPFHTFHSRPLPPTHFVSSKRGKIAAEC